MMKVQVTFGTASGFRQQHFEWHRLFKLAGLSLGRDKGVVWHSLRHEFCSRTAENTGDPVIAQELARHKDLRTTQGYLHARARSGERGERSLDATGHFRTITRETLLHRRAKRNRPPRSSLGRTQRFPPGARCSPRLQNATDARAPLRSRLLMALEHAFCSD